MIVKIQKFEASWCCQCKAMDRNLDRLTNMPVEHIDVEKLSEDELTELGIRNLPVCFLIDENGNKVTRINGIKTAEEVYAEIAKANQVKH
jgi:thiol-disulfide isomerase/thioredoxin